MKKNAVTNVFNIIKTYIETGQLMIDIDVIQLAVYALLFLVSIVIVICIKLCYNFNIYIEIERIIKKGEKNMLKKTKRFLALLVAGVLLCGNFPVDGSVMQVNAADGTLVEAREAFGVSFDKQYAEVGKELSVTVTGATDVSYKWSVGGKTIANRRSTCHI